MSRPFRFTFIIVLAAIGTLLAAVGGWRYARASAPVNGPIIVISIDTLRFDHLPAYGYKGVRTPAIDALAADGVVFERAYSHSPLTLPAHAALLSGRLPFDTGVRDNIGFAVKPGERLLPDLLRDRGYATGGVVSAFVLRKETGINRGFDFFDGEMPPTARDRATAQVERDGGESETIAERWLDLQRSSRLFLFLHLYEPHAPYAPPERYAALAPYDGEIAYSDEILGRLVRYLKAHQLYDGSTIVLVSDHGEGLGDHGEQEHGLFLYDEVIHVPLIVKQAGGAGGGRRVADLVQHVDLVPTILDLVKAPIPGQLRGRSLKPLLDGTGHLAERAAYAESLYGRLHFGWSELAALTDGRFRYVKAPQEEIYNLASDPHERENRAAARQEQALAGRKALDRLVGDAAIQIPADPTIEDRERLDALGYVDEPLTSPPAAGAVLADPKDHRDVVDAYRSALDLAGDRKWTQAISVLQRILAANPDAANVWSRLARFALWLDRTDLAINAHRHLIDLEPSDPVPRLGLASALFKAHKLEEARAAAQEAADAATERDARSRGAAHELLARIALARHDVDAARSEAASSGSAEPGRPLAAYIDARLLYDHGSFADAWPFFEQALAELARSHTAQIGDLHYQAADTLVHLARHAEAEAQFVEELRFFPHNFRARAGLATLYGATGRPDAAGPVLTEMTQVTPTPESFALAARVWTTLGDRRQAEAVRAEARRTVVETSRLTARRTPPR